jgi:hypothetical protein
VLIEDQHKVVLAAIGVAFLPCSARSVLASS